MESVEDIVLGEGVSASGAATEEELLGLDEHSWVQWYQKSWLEIEEAVDGRLVNPESVPTRRFSQRSVGSSSSSGIAVKRGLIRFVYIVVDFSAAMRQADYKPSRIDFVVSELVEFVSKFFAANPLSYVSLIAMRNGQANYITRMNGQPNLQIKRLKKFIAENPPSGSSSLVKALELVLRAGDLAMYASREVLVVWGSLASVDPQASPLTSLPPVANTTIISLSPEVFAVKNIASNFFVTLSAADFRAKLAMVYTPKESASVKPVYIKMGFPVRSTDQSRLTKCGCHKDLCGVVFTCPQCSCAVCEIPTNCPVCKLTLVDKEMLIRVHRLLYDMPACHEVEASNIACSGCFSNIAGTGAECSECKEIYCRDCDAYSQEGLRHCIGCLTASA